MHDFIIGLRINMKILAGSEPNVCQINGLQLERD
jgi:hypothetical protein